MSKHHHQSMTEQIDDKGHASAPFHYVKAPYQLNELMEPADDSSIQLRAYQIHLEKGGSDLDNWLEAERSLRNL